jgi:hypothetical protein
MNRVVPFSSKELLNHYHIECAYHLISGFPEIKSYPNMDLREGHPAKGPDAKLREELITMTHQSSEFRFTVNPEASASFHDDGIVILHLGSGRLFTSNKTGASIWRRVEQEMPLEAITQEISNEYQIASSTSRDHVVHFLSTLEQHTLIQREAVS